jgi:hypothetical protein
MLFISIKLVAIFGVAMAHGHTSTSICDRYAVKILGSNTAQSQSQLLTILFNTIVIGNYTTHNTGIAVAGIAAPATYNGTKVNLLPYFTGGFNSTNDGVTPHGVPKLFLDDGGAVPLAKSLPSNGNKASAQ